MKKILTISLALLMVASMVIVLVACGPGESLFRIDPPTVEVLGNTIMWTAVEDAINYSVYQGDQLVDTVDGTTYVVSGLTADTAFTVVANAEKESKNSDKSDSVVVRQQTGFAAEVSQTLEVSSGEHIIASNIKYLKITGSATDVSIVVADRTSDIIIELDNVTMTSMEGKSCIASVDEDYDYQNKHYSATIVVTGNNVLTGSNYTQVPATPATNSSKNGEIGGSGGSGIVLPRISITGSGTLVLNGGNGGRGGDGADRSGIISSIGVSYGRGGRGGAGGCGIMSSMTLITLDAAGIVEAYAGTCGAGGNPGGNGGGLINGALGMIGYDNAYGAEGDKGIGIKGTLTKISGTCMTQDQE